jgi:type I restriction enzyme M protein
MTKKDIPGIIKRIKNIMRKDPGLNGDAQRIDQLVWMLFLKIYDELKESNEYELEENDYQSIIPENCRWRNWAIEHLGFDGKPDGSSLTGDDLILFINGTLFPALKNILITPETSPKQAIVQYAFKDSHNYMQKGVLLRQVINELNSINFDDYEDRHAFNDIYETILKELQSAGSSGEFYTPRSVTDFIVEKINPQIGEIIADFACGTGGFLTSSIKSLLKNNTQNALETIQNTVIGTELKPLPYLLCVTNMLLNNLDGTNIRHGDSFSKKLTDYTEQDKVDCIVMNPPFGADKMKGVELNFPAKFRSNDTADLFVALILYRLKSNGRVGLVLPDGFLFGDGVKNKLKEKLLSECNLHTIVRLPSGVFAPYSPIKVNLLFFDKGTKTENIWYYKVPLPEGYKQFTKGKQFEAKHLEGVRTWWDNRENGDINSYKISIETIINSNYNLDIKNPNITEEKEELSLKDILSEMNQISNKISSAVQQLNELLKDINE